jgi:hypothetical protein
MAASEATFVCQRHDAFGRSISVGDALPRCCIWSDADDHSDIGLAGLGRQDAHLTIARRLGDGCQAILIRAIGSRARGAGIFHASREQRPHEQAGNEFKRCAQFGCLSIVHVFDNSLTSLGGRLVQRPSPWQEPVIAFPDNSSIALFVGVVAELDPVPAPVAEDKELGTVFAKQRDLETGWRLRVSEKAV